VARAAATLGKLGGSVSSAAKTAAVRANGALGGRPSPFRRVSRQNAGDRVYQVPETSDWANWRDADAVAYHGTLVALRKSDGKWVDGEGEPLSSDVARQFSRLKSIGITTH
jgi:hypothetical protein